MSCEHLVMQYSTFSKQKQNKSIAATQAAIRSLPRQLSNIAKNIPNVFTVNCIAWNTNVPKTVPNPPYYFQVA